MSSTTELLGPAAASVTASADKRPAGEQDGVTKKSMRDVSVVSTLYTKKGRHGDFKWMVKQKQYDDAIFLVAENFLDSLRNDVANGGGTAAVRMHCIQRMAPGATPRAVGVPTGWSFSAKGFPQLDNDVKMVIDLSLDRIALVFDMFPQFKRLIYSCDAEDPLHIGVSIFEDTLDLAVRQYISKQIHAIASRAPQTTLREIREAELPFLRNALHIDEEKRRLASAASSSMVQHTLITGSKRPFGKV